MYESSPGAPARRRSTPTLAQPARNSRAQLARALRIGSRIDGLNLDRHVVAADEANLPGALQHLQAGPLEFLRDAETPSDPAGLVCRQRAVTVQLERAQHGVRPGLIVRCFTRALEQTPGVSHARQPFGIGEAGDEVEHAAGGELDQRPITQTYVFSDPDQCKRHFTSERWQAFKTDVAWFESVSRGDYWERIRVDHGYNPPPVWTMTGKLLASLAPAGDHFFKLLASLDVLLQLGALLLIGWAFDWRIMSLAAVFWGCNGPANFFWTGGAFLRQDWYFLLVAALCLARKRWFALSGAALTWSTLLRIFPIVIFLGPAYLALAGSSQILLTRFYWIDDRYLAESWLFLLFGCCTLYVFSRPCRRLAN